MRISKVVSNATTFVVGSTRGLLVWTESRVPWPASLVPRTMRIPVDIASAIALEVIGRPERPPGRESEAATGEPERREPRPGAAARTTGAREPAREHRTSSIAGTRSEGPDDAPRFDRAVRARLAPLYCRDIGRGPAVVLLHAFPLNARMWEPQIAALSSRFRVLAPDLAGFGLSWTPDASLSLDEHASAVESTLDDLGVAEAVVVGLSMGGYVAFPLLERLGSRVRGLVLANTRSSADGADTVADRHRLAAEVLASGVEVAAAESLTRILGRSTLRDRPELVDRVHAIALENKPEGVAGALRAMASRPDATASLSRIACPVLLLGSDEDELASPEAAYAMAARIPRARVEIVPRAGHLSSLEAPDEFNRLLLEFLAEVTRARPQARRAAAAGRR